MKLPRIYDLSKYVSLDKAVVLYGPRQVGKTTLIEAYLENIQLKYKLDLGDDIRVQQTLSSGDVKMIQEYLEGYELYVIDEAQLVPEIGRALKIIVDYVADVAVVATGSASFELSQQVGEPLVGRKKELMLFPLSQMELLKIFNRRELKDRLEDWLIYGSYPEVLTAKTKKEKRELLDSLVGSYLLKDILSLEQVKGSRVLLNILKLLAFQVGQLVSVNEIASQVGLDVKTVGRYLDLFEKSFIIKSVGGYSRNLRKEVVKKQKYYFIDNGVRNGVVAAYNSLGMRDDVGKLWENFIFMERWKKRTYSQIYGNCYFWRTYDGKEVDLVEEREGKLYGYEMKYGGKKPKAPGDFLNSYNEAEYRVVNKENYLDSVV